MNTDDFTGENNRPHPEAPAVMLRRLRDFAWDITTAELTSEQLNNEVAKGEVSFGTVVRISSEPRSDSYWQVILEIKNRGAPEQSEVVILRRLLPDADNNSHASLLEYQIAGESSIIETEVYRKGAGAGLASEKIARTDPADIKYLVDTFLSADLVPTEQAKEILQKHQDRLVGHGYEKPHRRRGLLLGSLVGSMFSK